MRGGALGGRGERRDAAAVRAGGAVRPRPALPELPEEFRVIQARPCLGFNLLELELVTEVRSAVVDRLLPREQQGGVLLRRHQAGQHNVGEGKQHPCFGIHNEQFFFHAESAHDSIVRQDPPKRPWSFDPVGCGRTPGASIQRIQSWKYSIFAPMVLSRSARSS